MRTLLATSTLLLSPALAPAQIVGELAKFVPADAEPGDDFARDIDSSGDRALFGSIYDYASSGDRTGSAYLYDVPTGQQLARFTPHGGEDFDFFGYSVALDGDLALVGAPGTEGAGSASGVGAAYLIDTTTGAQLFKLRPGDPVGVDGFGWAVALSGNHAVVGADNQDHGDGNIGAVYLYDATTGQQTAKLVPGVAEQIHQFGRSLDIEGDRLLVGAPDNKFPNNAGPGAAYLYDLSTLQLIVKLTASDGADGATFGQSVDLSGELAIVGAPLMQDFGWATGAAYLFEASSGVEQAKLLPDDVTSGMLFGQAVAVGAGRAVVGAMWHDAPQLESGAAYVFDAATARQTAELRPSDSMGGNAFGAAVEMQGDDVLVGAEEGDLLSGPVYHTGAAYLFDLGALGSPYCFGDGSGVLCTCGLLGNPGEGCGNSSGQGGASLSAAGLASITQDTFSLAVAGVPGAKPGLILRGADQVGGGLGIPSGDGLLCTSGQTARSQVQVTSAGATLFTDFQGQPFGAWSYGAGVSANYQFWYRDPANTCTGEGFNFSNAWTVTWAP